jgi:NADPH-dependent 2,4-dienoyl-CoA reductase/sulfur reductase-like enzyme
MRPRLPPEMWLSERTLRAHRSIAAKRTDRAIAELESFPPQAMVCVAIVGQGFTRSRAFPKLSKNAPAVARIRNMFCPRRVPIILCDRVGGGSPMHSDPTIDLCVIGAGAAALSVAAGAAQLGTRVVLIEGDKMGGECLNTGGGPVYAQARGRSSRSCARCVDPRRANWRCLGSSSPSGI